MSAGQDELGAAGNGDDLAAQLAQFDDSLKGGSPPAIFHELPSEVPPASQSQWQRAQACLRLLEEAWPRRRAAAPQSVPAGGAAAQTSSGGKTLGRFEIRRELGRGGFGVVHLAFDPRLGREVALKVPHAQVFADPELHGRFQREARAAAGLDHPNIVPVYEAGEVDSVGYIALAYCPGITLHDWLRRRIDSISGPAIAEFMATLAGAIHHAHEQGVIHRDLKPANVLLGGDWADAPGYAHQPPSLAAFAPKITDFGLAKQLDSEMTQTHTGTIAGTPCYMAPEQTGRPGSEIGPATDVYSLGALLYELLTGRAPFQGETVLDTLDQVRNMDPIPPRRLRPGIPRDLEIICLKCLEKDPGRRYASAKLLEEDFRRYLGGRSIVARPTGPISQMAKWARRRPAVAALVAVSGLAAIVLIGSDMYIRAKNRETEQALKGEIEARRQLTKTLARESQALYFHRIRLAQATLADGNVRQAERYLQTAASSDSDLIGWEWHYLKHLSRSEQIEFRHPRSVQDVALTHDGSRAASISTDGQGMVWNTSSGEVQWRFTGTAATGPRHRRLAFSGGGQYLACGNHETNVVTVYAADGKELYRVRGCQSSFTASDSELATIDMPPEQVRIYSAASGEQLRSYLLQTGTMAALASDGASLTVAMTEGGTIRVRRLPGGEESVIGSISNSPAVLAVSGGHVAAGMADGHLHVWEIEGGTQVCDIRAHVGMVETLNFHPQGKQIATADTLGTIKVWDLQGREQRSFPGHGYVIRHLAYSGDGRKLASASGDSTVRIWDATRDPRAIVFREHPSFAFAIAFSPDGQQLASSGAGQSLHLWNSSTGEVLRTLTERVENIRKLAYSADGQELIGTNGRGQVSVWDVASGKLVRSWPGEPGDNLLSVALGPNGVLAAAESGNRAAVIVRDTTDGHVIATLPQSSPASCVEFSPDGSRLAIAAADHSIGLWEIKTGRLLHTLRGLTENIHCLAFSHQGKRLASGGQDRLVRIWDLDTGRQILAIDNPWGRSNLYALAFSPDDRRLAGGKLDASVLLWDAATGQEVIELPCQGFGVTSLAFEPGGRRLAAIINDGTVMVWDAAPRR